MASGAPAKKEHNGELSSAVREMIHERTFWRSRYGKMARLYSDEVDRAKNLMWRLDFHNKLLSTSHLLLPHELPLSVEEKFVLAGICVVAALVIALPFILS